MASSSSYFENGSSAKPPKFNPANFAGWKGRMLLYLENLDFEIPDILSNGPYVPTSAIVSGGEGARGTLNVPKDRRSWTIEEVRLVSLDAKARNHIVMALPDEVFHSVGNISTAKEMWDTLCVTYEGTAEVQESKAMHALKNYELFVAQKSESLTQTYSRFTCLVNDLNAAKIYKSSFHLMTKFLDALPEEWRVLITVLKNSGQLKSISGMSALYGILLNDEQTRMQQRISRGYIECGLIAEKEDELRSAENSDHPSSPPHKTACDNEAPTNSEDSSSDNNLSDLSQSEMTSLVKKFKRFRSRGGKHNKKQGYSAVKPSAENSKFSTGMSKAECYRCGRFGHFAADCKVKTESSSSIAAKYKAKAEMYKAKYLLLKQSLKEKSEKGLMATEDFVWSTSSSDDDDPVVTTAGLLAFK